MIVAIVGLAIGLTVGYFKYVRPNETDGAQEVLPDEESRIEKHAYDTSYRTTRSNMSADTPEQARSYAKRVKATGTREWDSAAKQIDELYRQLDAGTPDHDGYRAAVRRSAAAKAMIDCANDIEAESYGIRRIK